MTVTDSVMLMSRVPAYFTQVFVKKPIHRVYWASPDAEREELRHQWVTEQPGHVVMYQRTPIDSNAFPNFRLSPFVVPIQ